MSIALYCNPSPSLAALYAARQAPLDGIECTSFQSPREMKALRKVFTGLPFQFHASNLGRTLFSRARLNRCHVFCPESRWVSIHLAPLPPLTVYFGLRWGIHLPQRPADRLVKRLVRQITALKPTLSLPLILENMPANKVLANPVESDPVMIAQVLEATGCDLLLDLAHARVAAAFREMPVETYLAQLPLDKVRQIHISGTRMQAGSLQDAHESLNEDDYDLLAWTLERTRPEILTLEYFRDDRDALREMLVRLREMLDAAGGAG
jgi:uncharacterized protein (UPF0276 family)